MAKYRLPNNVDYSYHFTKHKHNSDYNKLLNIIDIRNSENLILEILHWFTIDYPDALSVEEIELYESLILSKDEANLVIFKELLINKYKECK